MGATYYDYDGVLLRVDEGKLPPKQYKGNGQWERTYREWGHFSQVSEEDAKKIQQEFDRMRLEHLRTQ